MRAYARTFLVPFISEKTDTEPNGVF